MPGIVGTRPRAETSIWDQEAVLKSFREWGIKEKHAKTVWRHLLKSLPPLEIDRLRENGKNYYSLSPLRRISLDRLLDAVPQNLAKLLDSHDFVYTTSQLEEAKISNDRTTTKLLIRLQSGKLVETVIMHYDQKVKLSRPRNTVCLSSQVGCKMACTFCATGTMGLFGNLHASEMIEQLIHASRVQPIRNVVFMGMGEPLDNYDNLILALQAMIDQSLFSLSPAHICVSTVGVIPNMTRLLSDMPGVKLALSLHAPTQELRKKIVPTSRSWPLDRLMSVLDDINSCGDRVMIEYILIRDVNDTLQCAHQLGQLLEGKDVMVNLIPYNPTDVSHDYKSPLPSQPALFETVIRTCYGIRTTVRRTMGQDIDGACGQLVIQKGKGAKLTCTPDMEDLFSQNSSRGPMKGDQETLQSSFRVDPSHLIFVFIIALVGALVYRHSPLH